MHVSEARIGPAPNNARRVRVSAEIAYEHGEPGAEVCWFDFPDELASQLSTSGTPWLAAILPMAGALHEPIEIAGPVDPLLLEASTELLRVWHCWHPYVEVVDVRGTPLTPHAREAAPRRSAAFFSGGVDSWHALLTRDPDDLLLVWGFDIALAQPDVFARMRERYARIAGEFGKPLIDVATNLRTTRWGQLDWPLLSHGAALAAVALLLEPRLGRVFIGSTGGYGDLAPWGSHVVTDPMFSTTQLRIIPDGAGLSRSQKTAVVAQSPLAMRHLRVCFALGTDENCGRCNKCLRTMTTLELLGALPQCETFPDDRVDVRRLSQAVYRYRHDAGYTRDIRALAVERQRLDIVRAIDHSLRRSRAFARRRALCDWLCERRGLWRLVPLARRWLLGRPTAADATTIVSPPTPTLSTGPTATPTPTQAPVRDTPRPAAHA